MGRFRCIPHVAYFDQLNCLWYWSLLGEDHHPTRYKSLTIKCFTLLMRSRIQMGCHCLSSREDKKVGRRGIKSPIPSYGNLNEGEESATYLHWFYKVIPWERSRPGCCLCFYYLTLDWRSPSRSARDSSVVDEKIAKAAYLQILLKFALTRYVLMVDLSSLCCLLAVCDRRVNI